MYSFFFNEIKWKGGHTCSLWNSQNSVLAARQNDDDMMKEKMTPNGLHKCLCFHAYELACLLALNSINLFTHMRWNEPPSLGWSAKLFKQTEWPTITAIIFIRMRINTTWPHVPNDLSASVVKKMWFKKLNLKSSSSNKYIHTIIAFGISLYNGGQHILFRVFAIGSGDRGSIESYQSQKNGTCCRLA